MQNKITIITSGHPPFDERIFWKFGLSFIKRNYSVQIICSTADIDKEVNGINIKGFSDKNITKKEKISRLLNTLKIVNPNIIICCEPLTILPAFIFKKKYSKKCKIISDITEWYPENITSKMKGFKKALAYIFLCCLNICLTNLADALIIGEITKKRRYDFISSFKKKVIIGYYPVLSLFEYSPPPFEGKNLTLCYAGLVSFQRGIKTLVKVACLLAERHNNINIRVKIVGKFQSPVEEKEFDDIALKSASIKIEKSGWTEYSNISNLIKDTDICFDLREWNFIYNNSLPIKVFEYMAAGKPFMFSDIRPIRKELGEITCGFLVDPSDKEEIIKNIEAYINTPALLKQHSENGRTIIENRKNWERESDKLTSFIEGLINAEQSR
jgi:glycosyltransferase involved in cell wall biosynthesis